MTGHRAFLHCVPAHTMHARSCMHICCRPLLAPCSTPLSASSVPPCPLRPAHPLAPLGLCFQYATMKVYEAVLRVPGKNTCVKMQKRAPKREQAGPKGPFQEKLPDRSVRRGGGGGGRRAEGVGKHGSAGQLPPSCICPCRFMYHYENSRLPMLVLPARAACAPCAASAPPRHPPCMHG